MWALRKTSLSVPGSARPAGEAPWQPGAPSRHGNYFEFHGSAGILEQIKPIWCHRCQRAEITGVGRATDSEFCLWDLGETGGRVSTNCRLQHGSVRWQTSPASAPSGDSEGKLLKTWQIRTTVPHPTKSSAFRHFYRPLYQNEASIPMPFSSG